MYCDNTITRNLIFNKELYFSNFFVVDLFHTGFSKCVSTETLSE